MSHNEIEPHGNGQTQQPGPYVQPQTHLTPVPPPSQARTKRNTGVIAGVTLAVIAGGVYYFTVASDGDSVVDDGPHKLTTPTSVLGGEYEKDPSSSSAGGFNPSEIQEAQQRGAKNLKGVDASYSTGDTTELTGRTVRLVGLYGEIAAPEKAVDGMFAKMRADDAKHTEGVELVGAPRDFSTEDSILKCQETKFKNVLYDGTPQNGPKTMKVAVCIWGDHSTLARVIPMNIEETMAGDDLDLKESAGLAAKVRKAVRVEK